MEAEPFPGSGRLLPSLAESRGGDIEGLGYFGLRQVEIFTYIYELARILALHDYCYIFLIIGALLWAPS